MSITDQFRTTVKRYVEDMPGLSATALGVAALNDPRFVHDLLAGKRSPSAKTMDRVLEYIAANPVPATPSEAA